MASYSDQEFMLTGDLENYNMVKEAVIDSLCREEFITQEQAETIKNNYAVVLAKNNWLGIAIGKLLGKRDSTYIKVMKIV
jgi:hypothetical protein